MQAACITCVPTTWKTLHRARCVSCILTHMSRRQSGSARKRWTHLAVSQSAVIFPNVGSFHWGSDMWATIVSTQIHYIYIYLWDVFQDLHKWCSKTGSCAITMTSVGTCVALRLQFVLFSVMNDPDPPPCGKSSPPKNNLETTRINGWQRWYARHLIPCKVALWQDWQDTGKGRSW